MNLDAHLVCHLVSKRPIMPIHRHLEEPFCKGNFADLTCDSDGKLNNFIDDGKIKSLLNLHEPEKDKDYLIGIHHFW